MGLLADVRRQITLTFNCETAFLLEDCLPVLVDERTMVS